MNKIRAFFAGYADELMNKVTWPKAAELQNNTVTVLVASFIIAVVIALVDLLFNQSLSALYSLFN